MRNTLVLFVSDHGDMIGDLELIAKGAFFYDPCTRVPMIMRLPDVGAGRQPGARPGAAARSGRDAAARRRHAGRPAWRN